MADGMSDGPQSRIAITAPLLISHFCRTSVMSCHQVNEDAVELVRRGRSRLLHLLGRQIPRHAGALLCGACGHGNCEPASPPPVKDPVLSGLARDDRACQSPKMRIRRALLTEPGELDTLHMMRGHVADIGLVGLAVGAHPRPLPAKLARKRNGRKNADGG